MYGKHFTAMYTGSMRGAGSVIFAVWGYVIAYMIPDEVVGAQVELNTELMAFLIGEKEENIKLPRTKRAEAKWKGEGG